VWQSFLSIFPHLVGGTMATSQTCCHLPGEMLNSADECADRARIVPFKCTGNGLVVPSSSHKREVTGSIPAGCTKTYLFPHPLLPHRLMSHFDVWRHLSLHKNRTRHRSNKTKARPAHVEKRRCYHYSLLERSGKRRIILTCN
jgi:hypothetical protein